MKKICTKILINASPAIIWDIITDFENYGKWNPFIREISGTTKEGSTIQVFIKPPNSNGMKFKPEILKYEPEKEIRWLGKLWIPKIFDGEHSLTIKKIEENKVLFIQKEQFNGLLVPLFTNMLKDTKLGFQMMNQKLKQKAEEKME
ncbi:MAG: SRPBCC domain-containing protein [Methanobacterium sp.]|uniref:SRPBCC family protein n=1 Tax=Methanobacterium sp. TaxID=2164 RepID=UPI003C74D3E1